MVSKLLIVIVCLAVYVVAFLTSVIIPDPNAAGQSINSIKSIKLNTTAPIKVNQTSFVQIVELNQTNQSNQTNQTNLTQQPSQLKQNNIVKIKRLADGIVMVPYFFFGGIYLTGQAVNRIVIQPLYNWRQSFWQVKEFFVSLITSAFSTTWETCEQYLTAVVDYFEGFGIWIKDEITGFVMEQWEELKHFFIWIKDEVKEFFSAIFLPIESAVKAIVKAVVDAWNYVADTVSTFFCSLFQYAIDTVTDFFDWIKSKVGGLLQWTSDKIDRIIRLLDFFYVPEMLEWTWWTCTSVGHCFVVIVKIIVAFCKLIGHFVICIAKKLYNLPTSLANLLTWLKNLPSVTIDFFKLAYKAIREHVESRYNLAVESLMTAIVEQSNVIYDNLNSFLNYFSESTTAALSTKFNAVYEAMFENLEKFEIFGTFIFQVDTQNNSTTIQSSDVKLSLVPLQNNSTTFDPELSSVPRRNDSAQLPVLFQNNSAKFVKNKV